MLGAVLSALHAVTALIITTAIGGSTIINPVLPIGRLGPEVQVTYLMFIASMARGWRFECSSIPV